MVWRGLWAFLYYNQHKLVVPQWDRTTYTVGQNHIQQVPLCSPGTELLDETVDHSGVKECLFGWSRSKISQFLP